MSEIPEDIRKPAEDCADELYFKDSIERLEGVQHIARFILAERNRCISIAQSIDPHNEAEAHLIETIVRRIRGDE